MFNLAQKLNSELVIAQKNLKKEKNAQISLNYPSIASGFKEQEQLGKLNTKTNNKQDNLVITDKPLTSGAKKTVKSPSVKDAVKTVANNPGVKIAYRRNTGLADVDGLPYTNTDDVELLSKLGYSVTKDEYLFLPLGESKEDLYSYVEKCAGVPKSPSRSVDRGEAFSGEYLKDMGYQVPEGYEVKGDLVCPVEKKANALVVSGVHGDEPAGDKAAEKLKDSVDVVSHVNPSDKRRFEGKDINRHFDKPTEGKVQKTILDIIRKKKPSKVIALHEDDEVDKPYAYSSESLKDETREALKEYSTAASAHGDKAEDGVISKGKNPPDGSLEKALDDRDIPRVTIETPSKAQDIDKRVDTQLDVVGKLLGKKADLTNTQPAMSGNSNVLQTTHSPINIQTSTQGQTTPVDSAAKNNALVAAGKSFAGDQLWGALPGVIGLGGGKLRNIASSVGPNMSARAAKGINALESGAHVGVGEVSAAKADNPRTANMDRGLSYLNSGLSYVPNPVVQGAALAGNVMYDAANAADVYHKTMSSAPPSMGKVPEQKFNVPLGQPASNNIDFRLTQPNLRDQYPSSGVRLAKQGEATHELKSSNIRAVGYDKENKRLEVAFHSGGNYRYNDVPKSLFARLKKAKSPGKFFHKHIKRDNPYKYEKMEKESAFMGYRPGMVSNFPGRVSPPISVGDRVGSLIMGKNYIPSPIDGESMYDAMLRSKRNSEMLNISRDSFKNNPLFHRLGLSKSPISSLLGVGDYMSQGKLSSILSPFMGGNVYQANRNIQDMLDNPSIMSQFKQASSNQPLLPGMRQWVKKQPFNHAEESFKAGRIPKHVRDDIVSGRAAERYRPRFKEMLEAIGNSRQKT